MVKDAGFELLETAIKTQIEQAIAIPYLWLFARKGQAT
jgi:hypothetical protein